MPSYIPSYANQQVRIAAETAYGTAATSGFRKLNNARLDIEPTFETEQFAASGDAVPSINSLNDDYTQGDMEGKACYNSVVYPLSSLFGPATISTPAGDTNSRQWLYSWDGKTPFSPVSYTVQVGIPGVAEQVTGALFNGFSISGSREGMDFSTAIWGKAVEQGVVMGGVTPETQTVAITGTPTGGTFTLTFRGATTGPIAYNASATTVRAALEALSTIGTGNVGVSGSALPGGTQTVTFSGTLAGQDVPLMTASAASLTGGTSPAVAVAAGTAGADAVTEITPAPMFPLHFSLFMDNSWAGLGTTRLLQAYEMDLGFGEKFERTRPINALLSSDGYVEMADQEHTVSLNFAVDATQRSLIDSLRAGSMKFIRIEAEGPVIENTTKHLFRMDMACFITEAGPASEYNSIYTREFTFRLGRDTTSGNCAAVKVINTVTAL